MIDLLHNRVSFLAVLLLAAKSFTMSTQPLYCHQTEGTHMQLLQVLGLIETRALIESYTDL